MIRQQPGPAKTIMETTQPGTPGTPTPGTAPNAPSTDGSPNPAEFLTKTEFNRSAAMIRRLDESLTTLQGGLGNMLTLDSLAQVGLLDVEEVDGKKTYKPKGSTATAPKARADDDPLVQRLKTLETQLERAKREKDDSDKAVAAASRDNAIIEALREAGARNPQRDYLHLQGKVQKGDQGYFAKGTDEAGYEIELKLPDLVKDFLKANPELKTAPTQGGAGSPAGGGTGQNPAGPQLRPGQTIIPKSQWQNMEWFMQNRDKFNRNEYVRGQ